MIKNDESKSVRFFLFFVLLQFSFSVHITPLFLVFHCLKITLERKPMDTFNAIVYAAYHTPGPPDYTMVKT